MAWVFVPTLTLFFCLFWLISKIKTNDGAADDVTNVSLISVVFKKRTRSEELWSWWSDGTRMVWSSLLARLSKRVADCFLTGRLTIMF